MFRRRADTVDHCECHEPETKSKNYKNKEAQTKLIIAALLALTFAIAEAVGMLCYGQINTEFTFAFVIYYYISNHERKIRIAIPFEDHDQNWIGFFAPNPDSLSFLYNPKPYYYH